MTSLYKIGLSGFSTGGIIGYLKAKLQPWTAVLKRSNKVETAAHGCNLAFSLDSIVSLPR